MVFLSEVKVGKHTYIYECEGYRTKVDGVSKARSRRKTVGKIDPVTGRKVFYPDYIERMKLAGTPVAQVDEAKQFSASDIKSAEILEFGLTNLLQKLAKNSGLLDALRTSNPAHYAEIFTLAIHLVASGDPFMHTQEWLDSVEITEPVGNLSSQKISKILADIMPEDAERFFGRWAKKRTETEYLALDITSSSSYSALINDVEWGYNRDGENLAQINLCMLMGETSRLPVYQTSYSGSLKDVSTLKSTLAKFKHISASKPILAVMDKGFYSKKNIDDMLENSVQFINAVPFSSSFAKAQVADFSDSIDTFENTIVVGKDTLRASTKRRKWSKKFVYVHIYYNPLKAATDREKIYLKVAQMQAKATETPNKYAFDEDFLKYFNIIQTDSVWTVKPKTDVIDSAYKHAGWLVIISSKIKSAPEALRIYRAKDVVEKGFLRLKNSLDLGRLRVHSDAAMQSKIFIGFVALVLMMQIHNTMLDKNLYRSMTMKELLRTLSKLRVLIINGERIEMPKTKALREIYEAFGIAC